MTKNFALTLEYDGTAYHGWQLQKNAPTVQGVLLDAIERICGVRPTIYASGRTDAGVHALAQMANFRLETSIPPEELRRALNARLPEDVVVKRVEEMEADFHAQYRTRGKAYKYVILNRESPSAILRNYAWHIISPLDVHTMREGAQYLVGTHDFRAFWGGDSDLPRDSVRTIEEVRVLQESDSIEIRVTADGFLRYMVRTIAGTLVEVGKKKRRPQWVKEILESKDRTLAGPTAPACGLFLVEVLY